MRPTHSPKPTRASSSVPHTPRIVISSPSSRNILFSPPAIEIESLPLLLCSRKLPNSAGEVPLMVPEPSKSPGWKGHPLTVWCASICGKDHSRFRALTLHTVALLPDDAGTCQSIWASKDSGVEAILLMSTSRLISYTVFSFFSLK
jgi:hypothetical protein